MKATSLIRFTLWCAALLCFQIGAVAATLQAKVIDVASGNAVVVSNINRSLKVRLKGIASPEVGQPFSDVARDHLKALVFEKAVAVEYTNFTDGYFEAKVTLNGIDIGSQMIRDGVAWYDRSSNYSLTNADQVLYAQCEQAARDEHRGLWGDRNPVAPWEYRRAQAARIEAIVNPVTVSTSTRRNPPRPEASLSNSDLFGKMFGNVSGPGLPGLTRVFPNGTADMWLPLDPLREHFSVLLPGNAVHFSVVAPAESGEKGSFQLFAGGGSQSFFAVAKVKQTSSGEEDSETADSAVQEFIAGMNDSAASHGEYDLLMRAKPGHNLRLNKIFGRQYALESEKFAGTIRVLVRQVNDEQELFILYAVTRLCL